MKIAGLDIGSTGCKLTVFDEGGARLGQSYRDYPVTREVGRHEIDVSALMDSVYEVIGEMASAYPGIAGIGVTSFGESFIMTDRDGRPLNEAMLYTDPRGKEECAYLADKLGAERITHVTGLVPHEMYSVSKIMWIKKHRGEVYAAAKHIFLVQDYVVWHLTGVSQLDYALATRTMAFDVHALAWSGEILAAAGIDEGLLSRPVPAGTPAGTVTPEAARRTGLNEKCVVVTSVHDQVAAATGAAAFDGSVAVDGAGTVECLTPVFDSLPDIGIMSKGRFCVVPHAVPGKFVTYAFNYTGGALIRWCMDTFGKGETYESMERARTEDGPTGLLVLPHFAGAATPYMDIGSKGAILGLTASTTAADIYRACMEGVAYEMRVNYEALSGTGIRFTRLNATGGGAKSRVWMQMKADILGLPITSLRTADAGTTGSAMLTGVAVGLFRDLPGAASVMVREGETFLPRAGMHERYMEAYERYKGVYAAVRPLV